TAKALNATGAVVAETTVVPKVDHAGPYRLALTDYRSEATVGSEVPIVLAMVDYYGNRIDNRREVAEGRDAESVTFSVGSPGDSAVFLVDGSVTGDTAVCPVDGEGNVTVTLRLARKAGENIVFVDLPSPIPDAYFTFYGLSDAPPASITCAVSPDGTPLPWVYADGKSTFTITCTLMDADGNPSVNRSVHVSTSLPGEEKTLRSNDNGLVMFTYGPKDKIGKVTITATSADNSSVTCSQTVEFTSTDPVDMILTASPQTMPSRDVKNTTAEIRAKVVDVKGNPVKGQTVTFSLSDINTAGYTATAPPELVEKSAVTNKNGSAIVHFRPGAFVQDRKNKASATGTCKVTANWGDDVEDLTLTWKNYPYLSVSTAVDNETVTVNQTVNVTVSLRGDGYALQPDPIDVVLAIDRSGSMLYDKPDRMHSVREAAKKFVDRMTTKDKVGLVTFGRNTGSWHRINKPGESSFDNPDRYIDNAYHTPKKYLDYATVDLNLTDVFPSVKTELDNIVPDSGTPMRAGLYKSIKELNGSGSSNPDPDAIKAIIVLSDGDYNWYGDPLARGDAAGYWDKKEVWDGLFSWHYEDVWVPTRDPEDFGDLTQKYYRFTDLFDEEQDLSVYAKNHNIKIYSIGYADTISDDGKKTLQKLAESTGGKYYDGSAANIGAIYTAIAGELKTEAGVNTKMDISFKDVEVNSEIMDGDAVFTYLHIPGKSTNISTWIDNSTPPYVPPHNPSYPYTEDQTTNWNDDHNLHFDIGTIHLNQTWTANYTLKVLMDGNINIFGQGSTISFDNGNETLDFPKTFITALPSMNNTGINTSYLWVGEPSRVGSGSITDFLRMKWNLNYTGNQTATQKLFYSIDEKRTWIDFGTVTPRAKGLRQEEAVLDVRDRPAAQYWIRVRAAAPDAPPAGNETSVSFFVGNVTAKKIRLQ
uniref:Ig-like domain-containing protein n=1 Tax=uncultured Methanofollis sp. TaxID=262500 RepID=UPI002638C409